MASVILFITILSQSTHMTIIFFLLCDTKEMAQKKNLYGGTKMSSHSILRLQKSQLLRELFYLKVRE